MNYSVTCFGELYCIFINSEAVFGFDRAMMSIKLDCRDFEYRENGIVLYGIEPNGLIRSSNTLTLSKESSLAAMHDSRAEILPLNGSRIAFKENGRSYSYTATNGDRSLTLELRGSCRCEGNAVVFRRGRTEIKISEPTVAAQIQKRRGFEYEAQRCLSLLGELTAESELMPLLLLVDCLKHAEFSEKRIETVRSLIPSMTEDGKITANAVLDRYYRAFGYEKKER